MAKHIYFQQTVFHIFTTYNQQLHHILNA